MAVPYERYEDEIEAADNIDNSSMSSEEEHHTTSNFNQRPRFLTSKQRYQEIFRDRWPRRNGLLQIMSGFVCAALAVVNIVILPLVRVPASPSLTHLALDRSNLFGMGLWAGLLLVVTGSLGMRAAMYKSVTTVYLFFAFVLFSIAAFIAFMILMLIGYSHGWTLPNSYKDGGALFYTQLSVNISVALALVLLLLSFTQYFEDVFCGELQGLRRAFHCCMPCWCPRVVEPEELMSEEGRPPSLPV